MKEKTRILGMHYDEKVMDLEKRLLGDEFYVNVRRSNGSYHNIALAEYNTSPQARKKLKKCIEEILTEEILRLSNEVKEHLESISK